MQGLHPSYRGGIDWASNKHAVCVLDAGYRAARARGCDHPHAVRILARAWARVLWRCWQDRTLYDPAQHGRALPFLPSPAVA
jgi:hypothetical protein